jgi:hypothetical protein
VIFTEVDVNVTANILLTHSFSWIMRTLQYLLSCLGQSSMTKDGYRYADSRIDPDSEEEK